ncbi:hypothetical protein BaRGS_00020121 [Batillaria attramentaria]|uniref:Uncharacterized protein n=1 Tax=Batillaria attramentaria TaxID=370345 RepID=A0ABD0KP34_9CAEN
MLRDLRRGIQAGRQEIKKELSCAKRKLLRVLAADLVRNYCPLDGVEKTQKACDIFRLTPSRPVSTHSVTPASPRSSASTNLTRSAIYSSRDVTVVTVTNVPVPVSIVQTTPPVHRSRDNQIIC